VTSASFTSSVRAAVVCCGIGTGLLFAPQWVTKTIRTYVRDAARPGQILVRAGGDFVQKKVRHLEQSQQRESEVAMLRSKLKEWELRLRRLQVENALLHERLSEIEQLGLGPYQSADGSPLIVPELLTARVLGDEMAALWRAGKLIDQGQSSGVRESSLVLEDSNKLIDQGADDDVAAGQPVYSGRCVVGKIAKVGHFSSTVQLLTDPEFRAFVQLARNTPEGVVFGANGILEGQGQELCRLKLISSTEPVEVGNEVYSGDRDGVLPFPMYYGTVVKANQKQETPHWEILVKPAVNGVRFKTVQVLRRLPNPLRLLSN